MVFNVMSKKDAEEYSKNTNIPKTAIISICDVGERADFAVNENIVDVLRLNFGDVNKEEPDAMTVQDAQKIKLFVEGVWDYASQIVVHCVGGVSRSAGVCAGLLKSLYNDDMQIFNNPKYCPNMHCYRLIVEEFLGKFNEAEAQKKLDHNIEIWKERFFGEEDDD